MGRIIEWFVDNRVAANLLMATILVGGLYSALSITAKQFPEIYTGTINVSVVFPGAQPAEVLDSIVVPIEDRLEGLEGVRKVTSTSFQGRGSVDVEVIRGADIQQVKDDIEAEIEKITIFPQNAERPQVTEVEPEELAAQIALSADASPVALKALAEEVRDDLLDLPAISRARIVGVPEDFIDIEITQETLRAYNTSLSAIARAIAGQSIDLSGGQIRTGEARISVRTVGERETARGFADIVLFTSEDGAKVRLGDIATITDGFDGSALYGRLDGRPVAFVSVFRIGQEQLLNVVAATETYLTGELQPSLPEGVEATLWRDEGKNLESRLALLAENGAIGVALILVILLIFLDLRVALWVSAGVIVAMVGTFGLMLATGVTINQLSLFGFILALGIVVDDAIVVGENAYKTQQERADTVAATKASTLRVYKPIIFSSLTTIAAFLPLVYLPGQSGSFIAPIAFIVIFVLTVSLVESLLILPHHLSKISQAPPRRWSPRRATDWIRNKVGGNFERFSNGPFRKLVRFCVIHPVFVLAFACAISFASFGLIAGGKVKVVFFPNIEGNFVTATVQLPESADGEATLAEGVAIAEAASRTAQQLVSEAAGSRDADSENTVSSADELLQGTVVSVGYSMSGQGQGAANIATIEARLADATQRSISASDFSKRWRELTGDVPGATRLSFSATTVGVGDPISILVSSDGEEGTFSAVQTIRDELEKREGVFDIRDDRFSAGRELSISLKPEASTYGVTVEGLATSLRAAFFGALAVQIQRNREEVDVRVRLREDQRDSIADLQDYRIPVEGGSIPVSLVADISFEQAARRIDRENGKTVTRITADTDRSVTTGGVESNRILEQVVPDLENDIPGLVVSLGGEQEEQSRFAPALATNFSLAIFAIYAILALAFGSYTRPLLILLIIPFGFVGALLGHAALGLNLTLLSIFGVIGLAGVIINDGLLIIDFIIEGEKEDNGADPYEAIVDATIGRFRPIVLTTLTTFLGVSPIILEQSVQAQFLVPTAVALGFGILFGSIILLLVIPALASIYATTARFLNSPAKLGTA